MKTSLSSIFFILFIFTTTLSLTSGVIHDSSGNTLMKDLPYHILPLPLLRGSGGGLTVTRTATANACTLDVTQEPFEPNRGVPFTFTPIVLDEGIIRGAYPITIEADVVTPCSGSKIWKAVDVPPHKDHDDGDNNNRVLNNNNKMKDDPKGGGSAHVVTTGGEFNSPESCFQIVEDDVMPGVLSYQIQYCPFKCGVSGSSGGCYNVGVGGGGGDGIRYLGRTDAVFPVVFVNAYGVFSSSAKTDVFSRVPAKLIAV